MLNQITSALSLTPNIDDNVSRLGRGVLNYWKNILILNNKLIKVKHTRRNESLSWDENGLRPWSITQILAKMVRINKLTWVLVVKLVSSSPVVLSSLLSSSPCIWKTSLASPYMKSCFKGFELSNISKTCGVCASAAAKAALHFFQEGLLLWVTFCVLCMFSSQN